MNSSDRAKLKTLGRNSNSGRRVRSDIQNGRVLRAEERNKY